MTHSAYPKKPPLESYQQMGTLKRLYTNFREKSRDFDYLHTRFGQSYDPAFDIDRMETVFL